MSWFGGFPWSLRAAVLAAGAVLLVTALFRLGFPAGKNKTAAVAAAGLLMALSLWAKTEAIASPTCTAVKVPDGVKDSDIIAAARAALGVVLSSGRDQTKGKLIRIGHMGPVAEPIYATVAVTAFGTALRKLGKRIDVGAGVEAALKVIASGKI